VARVFQENHKAVTRMVRALLERHAVFIFVALIARYKSVTRELQCKESCKSDTRLLQETYIGVTRVVHENYKSGTRELQKFHKSVKGVLQ
jgi:hypothetical protein